MSQRSPGRAPNCRKQYGAPRGNDELPASAVLVIMRTGLVCSSCSVQQLTRLMVISDGASCTRPYIARFIIIYRRRETAKSRMIQPRYGIETDLIAIALPWGGGANEFTTSGKHNPQTDKKQQAKVRKGTKKNLAGEGKGIKVWDT